MTDLADSFKAESLMSVGERHALRYSEVDAAAHIVGHRVGTRLTLAKKTEKHIVLRCGGHSEYLDRGAGNVYIPTQYWRYEMTDERVSGLLHGIAYYGTVVATLIPGRSRKLVEAFLSETL